MKHLGRFMFILFHIFVIIVIVDCEDQNYFEDTINPEKLVDPHSFYYDKQSKTMIKDINVDIASDILQNDNEVKNDQLNKDELRSPKQTDNYSSHEGIFYKRLVNLLLSNINIQDKNEVSIIGILEIEISHSQMETLQNFHVHKTSLREIDEIFSNAIKKPRYNYAQGITYICDILQKIFSTILKTVQEHSDGAMILFAMLMAYTTLKMMKWNMRFPIFGILQVIFILSFFMTWWQLIQEAEIKSTAAQMKYTEIPVSCQPDKMNMWDKIVSFFSSDDCEQYYKTVMLNPKLKITPAFALSHFITNIILHPLTHVGTVVSDFIHNATDKLPWAYAWIIKCILYLCVGFLIIMIPLCLSGASMNFNLGPLMKFGIGYHRNDVKGNSLQNIENREPVQIILQVPQSSHVAQVKNSSETKQLKAPEILKDHGEKKFPTTDSNFEEYCDDLSCGDTVKRIKLSDSDDEKDKTCEKLDIVKTEEHKGSGDG